MRSVLILSALLLSACTTPPPQKSLPHRQEWELYRQANSPASHSCPMGTFSVYVIEDDKPFFLECIRSNINE